MEEEGKLKISLTSLIMIILLILLFVLVILVIISNDKRENNNIQNNIEQQNVNNNTVAQNIIQGGNEEPNTNINMDFNFEFLKLENANKNIIYSPLSIKYALSMLNEGANGKTKEQITKVLNNVNLTKYQNIDKVLSLANAIYIRDSYSNYVKESYKNTLNDKYNAEIKYDAFKNANNVNKWIEDKTLGIIKNTLSDDMVQDEYTKLLLINALAIDMEWENSFESDKTYGREFNLANGQKMQATTMNKETSSDSISYYKDNNVTALTMNLKKYNDKQLEFMAIMPNSNISNYIKNITAESINSISKKMIPTSEAKYGIDIYIPKFSFDYELKLKEDLMNIGINDAFTPTADFSNMTNSKEGLYVSDAIHKANIDFTEKGVKAAAVTVFTMKANAMIGDVNEPEEVRFDKPFIYVIKDKNTNEIWFVGAVFEPNSWEKDKADYQNRY